MGQELAVALLEDDVLGGARLPLAVGGLEGDEAERADGRLAIDLQAAGQAAPDARRRDAILLVLSLGAAGDARLRRRAGIDLLVGG